MDSLGSIFCEWKKFLARRVRDYLKNAAPEEDFTNADLEIGSVSRRLQGQVTGPSLQMNSGVWNANLPIGNCRNCISLNWIDCNPVFSHISFIVKRYAGDPSFISTMSAILCMPGW